jgi:hypothetical protein
MAFPTTAVLDNFDRANGGLGANWSGPVINGNGRMAIISNQVQPGAAGADDYYNVATYAECEVYCDMPALPAANKIAWIMARIVSPNVANATDGYEIDYTYKTTTDTIQVYRIDNSSWTQLGATISQDFSAGDSLGMEIAGGTITPYRKTGGSWAALSARSDATYSAAGYIAFGGDDVTSMRLDNFGGGTIVAAGGSIAPHADHYARMRKS